MAGLLFETQNLPANLAPNKKMPKDEVNQNTLLEPKINKNVDAPLDVLGEKIPKARVDAIKTLFYATRNFATSGRTAPGIAQVANVLMQQYLPNEYKQYINFQNTEGGKGFVFKLQTKF